MTLNAAEELNSFRLTWVQPVSLQTRGYVKFYERFQDCNSLDVSLTTVFVQCTTQG